MAENLKFAQTLSEMKETSITKSPNKTKELEILDKELNDATHLALGAQRQLDEKTIENQKLKDLNTKLMERLKQNKNEDHYSESEIARLKSRVEELMCQVTELQQTNCHTMVETTEKNENVLKMMKTEDVCEIQMEVKTSLEVNQCQSNYEELLNVKNIVL